MILPLRQSHRRAWLVLALIIPFILFAAWCVREPARMMDQLPAELRETKSP